MGVANGIPGVSGGTMALIAGIYEELVDSIKSFDVAAVKLLAGLRFKEFADHVHLRFLLAVFAGAGIGIFSLARLLDYSFVHYPVLSWALFFGLILGSVFLVALRIDKRSPGVAAMFAAGASVAFAVTVLRPATGSDSYWYLLVCGAVATSSMILPGLSGSFVLILMGNYHLVMVDAVKTFNLHVLLPFIAGGAAGLATLSHLLSWLFRCFKDQALGLLSGFMLGSLAVLWPWKNAFDASGNIMEANRFGAFIDRHGNIVHDAKALAHRPALPPSFDAVVLGAVGLMAAGFIAVWAVRKAQK